MPRKTIQRKTFTPSRPTDLCNLCQTSLGRSAQQPTVRKHTCQKCNLSICHLCVSDVEVSDDTKRAGQMRPHLDRIMQLCKKCSGEYTGTESILNVKNELFNQLSGDYSCGVRQILISIILLSHPSNSSQPPIESFKGNIMGVWNQIRNDQRQIKYCTINFIFPIPFRYNLTEVRKFKGGPELLPSSIVKYMTKHGFPLKKYYIDANNMGKYVTEDLLAHESKRISRGSRLEADGYSVIKVFDLLKILKSNPNSYYMILINSTAHWVGVYKNLYIESVNDAPKPLSMNNMYLLKNQSGLILEFCLEPSGAQRY